jgi:hypothetical protein
MEISAGEEASKINQFSVVLLLCCVVAMCLFVVIQRRAKASVCLFSSLSSACGSESLRMTARRK